MNLKKTRENARFSDMSDDTRQMLHRGIDLILSGIELANEESCPALRDGIILAVRENIRALTRAINACVRQNCEHPSQDD